MERNTKQIKQGHSADLNFKQGLPAKREWTQAEIESALQSALIASTPDVWSKLDLTVEQEPAGERKAATKPAVSKKRAGILLFDSRLSGLTAAACVGLLLVGGGTYHYEYLQTACVVGIDVNPSVSLSLNRRDLVLKAEADNLDGEELLKNTALKGQKVDQAVTTVVDELMNQGYFKDQENVHAVLVSVTSKQEKKAEQVRESVSSRVELTLNEKQIDAVVYDQTVQVTPELEALAKQYQVSVGKAEFVDQLVKNNETLDPSGTEDYTRIMSQTMEQIQQEITDHQYTFTSGTKVIHVNPVKTDSMEKESDRDREEESISERDHDRDKNDAVTEKTESQAPETSAKSDVTEVKAAEPAVTENRETLSVSDTAGIKESEEISSTAPEKQIAAAETQKPTQMSPEAEETTKAAETKPAEEPTEVAETKPAEEPTEATETKPAEEPTEVAETKPAEEPTEVAETKPAEEPTEATESKPAEEPTEAAETELVEEPTEAAETKPAEESTEAADPELVEESTEAADPELVEEPTEATEIKPVEEPEIVEEEPEATTTEPEVSSTEEAVTETESEATTSISESKDETFDSDIENRQIIHEPPKEEKKPEYASNFLENSALRVLKEGPGAAGLSDFEERTRVVIQAPEAVAKPSKPEQGGIDWWRYAGYTEEDLKQGPAVVQASWLFDDEDDEDNDEDDYEGPGFR